MEKAAFWRQKFEPLKANGNFPLWIYIVVTS